LSDHVWTIKELIEKAAEAGARLNAIDFDLAYLHSVRHRCDFFIPWVRPMETAIHIAAKPKSRGAWRAAANCGGGQNLIWPRYQKRRSLPVCGRITLEIGSKTYNVRGDGAKVALNEREMYDQLDALEWRL